ncbi:hypothetical protein I551_9072 [Mycobacterium ulcerans str. Harvey]|uniref:Uncharacterized protein n=1 Tax=Mycobacterium ulcerans str. Harvey TaxID=1299332 RepID=A0ABN0R969_MYCUL|nr:hypothetical protein I551_9072 [Mycobacterium ulcerans str. Harvey]
MYASGRSTVRPTKPQPGCSPPTFNCREAELNWWRGHVAVEALPCRALIAFGVRPRRGPPRSHGGQGVSARDLAATADNDAQFMPALAVTSVLVMAALCIGYLCGRRAGSTRSGRIRRRRRTALAGMAFTVIALVVVRRARRSLRADAIPFPYR